MKKFLRSFLVIVLCVCACIGFAGCDNTKWAKTTNDTTKVTSNGGLALYHDGWVYFINGTKSVTEANVTSKNKQSAIYRAKADEDGEIVYKTSIGEDGKEVQTTEMKKVERVVSSLVGFDDSSLFIFGNYLYYATPSKGKNNKGDMLIGKTEFRRYDLKNKKSQLLYTTKSSDDTIQYSYYKQGESLYLTVYESTAKTLRSLKIGSDVKQVFKKTEVQSVVMSDSNCDTDDVQTLGSDAYIFYTLSYDKNSAIKRGVRVYSVKPNGKSNRKLSEGVTVSLMAVHKDHLIYADSNYIYAEKINDQTESLNIAVENIVCYSTYTDNELLFVDDGDGGIAVVVYINEYFRYIEWENGEVLTALNIEKLDSGDEIFFIGEYEEHVVYSLDSLIYKLRYTNIQSDENLPVQLTTTTFDEPEEDSKTRLLPEIMNGYIYGMKTDSSSQTTYLYRVNFKTPEERGVYEDEEKGVFKEIGEAELVGVKE